MSGDTSKNPEWFRNFPLFSALPYLCELCVSALGAVFKINRCFVSWKPCSAKATEAEVAQRAMPPRATRAQLGFRFTRRAQQSNGVF